MLGIKIIIWISLRFSWQVINAESILLSSISNSSNGKWVKSSLHYRNRSTWALKVFASFPSPQQTVVLVPYFSFSVFPHFMVISASWWLPMSGSHHSWKFRNMCKEATQMDKKFEYSLSWLFALEWEDCRYESVKVGNLYIFLFISVLIYICCDLIACLYLHVQ